MKKISRFSFSDGFLRAKTEQNPNMSTYGWQRKDVVTRAMGNGNAQSSILLPTLICFVQDSL
jgi:hypothetical protein